MTGIRLRCSLMFMVSLVAVRTVSAQAPAVIAGKVSGPGIGALAGVQVLLDEATRQTTSDALGRFRFDTVAAGTHTLRFRAVGYRPISRTITVTGGTAPAVDVVLVASITEVSPVVVTATRDARSLVDVPVPVSVADSTTIQATRTAGLHEVLRLTPGMQATSRFGLDDVNLSIRGSGVRTTFGVRGVAVVVDGVPVTEPDGQTRLDIIELGAARQVEVVRGPASALYGGTASGGVVNIISRSPFDSRGVSLRASSGSYGFAKYDGSVGGVLANGALGAYLSGTWTASDGFRAHNSNLMKRANLRAEWRPTGRTRIGVEASTSDLDMKIPGALTRDEFEADAFAADPGTVSNDHGRRDSRWRAGLKIDQSATLGSQTVEMSGYAFYGGRELDHPIFQVIDQSLHRIQAGARAKLGLGGDGRWQASFGGDYDVLYGSAMQFTNVQGGRGAQVLDQAIDLPNVGVFTQVEGKLSRRFGVILGGRWDRVEYGVVNNLVPARSASPDFTQFSPKATVSAALGPIGSAYLSVARGFDVPTLGELTASPDPAVGFNADIVPKRVWNYELGLKSFVTDRLFIDASVFTKAIRGELLPRSIIVPGSSTPQTVYENAGRSRNWGAEFAATASLATDVDLGVSYTWSHFRLEEFTGTVVNGQGNAVPTDFAGNALPGVPAHRVAAELRAKPIRNLTVNVVGEWQSRVFVDNANTVDGMLFVRGFGPNPAINSVPFGAVDPWGLVHVGASYKLAHQTLFVNVENLFDTRYVATPTLNVANGRFYGAGAGRYIAAGVSLNAFGGTP